MPDELETILRLVAEGHLSPAEAAPIIEALNQRDERQRTGPAETDPGPMEGVRDNVETARQIASDARDLTRRMRSSRSLRIRVTERGRQVVNLRIPVAFAEMAGRMVPGLSPEHSERIRDAIEAGAHGPILDIEDEGGDGVLISLE